MTTYTEAQLSALKLAEVTAIYNEMAEKVETKPVKKFRDKPTAVARTLDIQTKLPEEKTASINGEPVTDEEAKNHLNGLHKAVLSSEKEAKKSSKGNSKTDMNAKIVIVKQRNNQEGSIGEMMFSHIAEAGDLTVQELVDYMVTNYTKPRSNVPVTAAFVINSIRYFVREGSLNFA